MPENVNNYFLNQLFDILDSLNLCLWIRTYDHIKFNSSSESNQIVSYRI
jgi:hypothetical protein